MRPTIKAQANESSGPAPSVSGETIELAARGDRAALELVLKAYSNFARDLLRRLVGPGADVDDLLQMVLVKIVERISTYRFESAFGSWVGGICVFQAKTYFRSRARTRDYLARMPAPATTAPDAHQIAESRQDLAGCQRALEALSENQRIAFTLRVAYGYSVDEIATMTASARSTTRLRLYYARKAFARALARELPDVDPGEAGGEP